MLDKTGKGCYNGKKGGIYMKIAATYESGLVFQHFGHTPAFKLYTIEGGKITEEKICPTNGSGHGALAGFLQELGADALICGGIGGGARMALMGAGIAVFGGVSGNADEAAAALTAGMLSYDPNARCSHHEDVHSCSDHDHACGGHCH